MHEKYKGLPGSFYKVGYTYYYDRPADGKRLRISTGQIDLAAAVAWVKSKPFGKTIIQSMPELPHQFVTKLVNQARHNSKMANVLFKITVDDFYELYRRSKGYCEVSGIPFNLNSIEGARRRPYAPSIGRIERMRGYVQSNCRIVCASVNLAMNDFGEDVLWEIASSMVSRRNNKGWRDIITP